MGGSPEAGGNIVMKNFMRENYGSKYTVIRDGIKHCQLRSYIMLLELTNKKECSMLVQDV